MDSNHNLTEMRLISQKINRTIINSNNERIQKVFENILKNKLYENAFCLNFKTEEENLNLMKEIEEIISFCKEYHCCHRSISKAFLRLLKFLRYLEFHFIETDNFSKEILSTDHLNYSLWDHKEKEKIFIHACKGGHLKIINDFIDQDFIDPSAQNNKAIQVASSEGEAEVVELLLKDKRVNPSAQNNEAIRWASYHGRIKVVELLLRDERVDPSAENNEAIRTASLFGYTKIVELLLKHEKVDPSVKNNKQYIQDIKEALPELPLEKERRYVNDLDYLAHNAFVLTSDKLLADYFEKALEECTNGRNLCIWIIVEFAGRFKESGHSIYKTPILPEHLAELVTMIEEGRINGKIAKSVADEMMQFPAKSP